MSPVGILLLMVLAVVVVGGLSIAGSALSDRWERQREDRLVERVARRVREREDGGS